MEGTAEISIDNCFEAVAPTLSVTRNVISEFPRAVGVPLIAPLPAFRDNPAGSEPAVMLQFRGAVPPVLAIDCEYAKPRVPPEREVDVIAGAAAIANDNVTVAVAPTESLTVSVKLNGPADVGMPLISPVPGVRPMPAGRFPPDTDHVNGPVPPLREMTVENVVPTVPPVSVVVLIVSRGATTIDRPGDNAVAPTLSATRTIKLKVPSVDGVPLMMPVPAVRFNPAGIVPDITDQANGAVPPVACRLCEYEAPTVAAGSVVVVTAGGEATVMLSAFEAEAPTLSATRIVKLAVPGDDGVPLMTPVAGAIASPEGSDPLVIDHE
jgi:hypothetical protein